MINSGLIYRGELKITTKKKTEIIHNSGTTKLFELFLSALVTNVSESQRPSFIDIRDPDTGDSLLNRIIPVHKALRADSTYGYVCVISTSIRAGNMRSLTPVISNRNYDLCLLANNTTANSAKSILAELGLKGSVINEIISGRQALLEWSLSIMNASQNDT